MTEAWRMLGGGWYCAKCRHYHAGLKLANICVGCPCPETSPTTAEDDWIRIASQNAKDAAIAKELLAALKSAVETIKTWHSIHDANDGAWDIYRAHAPEMKAINAAIAKASEGLK